MTSGADKVEIRHAIGRAVGATQTIGGQMCAITLEGFVFQFKAGTTPGITDVVIKTTIIHGGEFTLETSLHAQRFCAAHLVATAVAR